MPQRMTVLLLLLLLNVLKVWVVVDCGMPKAMIKMMLMTMMKTTTVELTLTKTKNLHHQR